MPHERAILLVKCDFSYSCACSWQDFNWLKGSRGLSAEAELLVASCIGGVGLSSGETVYSLCFVKTIMSVFFSDNQTHFSARCRLCYFASTIRGHFSRFIFAYERDKLWTKCIVWWDASLWPSPGLVHYRPIYIFRGSCPVTELCQVQNSLCVQVLRSPILAALLHGTPVVGVSQTLWRWTEGSTYIRQGGHRVRHWPTF